MSNNPLTAKEIENICNKLVEIMRDADGFSASESQTAARICNNLKKLQIANALYEIDSIAITGLQGAGKTTFARTIYGIDRNILDIGAERSETVPVLIKESDHDSYTIIRHSINNESNWEFTEEEVPSLVENANSNTTTLYQELIVPDQSYFNANPNKGFVLMPGIESGNYFGGLLEFALACASTAVVVVNVNNIPNNSFDVFISENIRAFNGSQPIFVLTGCDYINEESKNDHIQSLIEKCIENGLPVEEDQILVSTTQENQIEQLKESFKARINKYCKVDRIKTQAHFSEILNDILRCLKEVDSYVETEQERKRIEFERNNQDAQTLLNEAKYFFEEARELVEREIHAAISLSKQESLVAWESAIHSKLPCGFFKSRRISKGRTNAKDNAQFRTAVDSAISQADFEHNLREIIDTKGTVSGKTVAIRNKGNEKNTEKQITQSAAVSNSNKALAEITPQSYDLIVNLTTPNQVTPFNLDNNDIQSAKTLKDSLEIISYTGTRYYMESLTAADSKDVLRDLFDLMPIVLSGPANIDTKTANWADSKQQQLGEVIGKVGAAIVAIDASDGKLDTVDAIKKTVTSAAKNGGTLSVSAVRSSAKNAVKAMSGIIASNPVGAAAVLGGALALAVTKEISKGMEAKAILVSRGKALIDEYYSCREEDLMKFYDKGIDNLTRVIYDNLRNHAQELLDSINRLNYSRRKEDYRNNLNSIIKRLESIESNARII